MGMAEVKLGWGGDGLRLGGVGWNLVGQGKAVGQAGMARLCSHPVSRWGDGMGQIAWGKWGGTW
jgi:hypothetical protein